MLRDLFTPNGMLNVIIRIPLLIIAFTVHEWAHAFIAYKNGDPTAKNQGRLTFNPLAHLDPIGTICILLTNFGWARPVPTNPFFYKNRKKGEIQVSLAGPLSNLILGFIFLVIAKLLQNTDLFTNKLVYTFFVQAIYMNIGLAVFNLLPVPPLDGSHIMEAFLPFNQYVKYMQHQQLISIVIFVLLLSGFLSPVLGTIIQAVLNLLVFIIDAVFKLIGMVNYGHSNF